MGWKSAKMRPGVTWAVTAAIVFIGFLPEKATAHEADKEITLPAPSGDFPVGVMSYHWVDGSTPDTLSPDPKDRREIMAQVWYPAKHYSGEVAAPYRPLARDIFGSVHSHAIGGAAFADMKARAPVILLCPGRGTSARNYTATAEELASRGYVVAAIDSKHSGFVEFPDGRRVSPSDKYKIPFEVLTGPYEKVDAFFEEATKFGASDAHFALSQLARLNKNDPGGRFKNRLNMKNLGAFGHSLGGRICGAVVGHDRRFNVYASMEGVPPRHVRRGGMRAAVLLLYGSYLPEEMALPNMEEVIPQRKNDVYIARIEGFGHNSVTDSPYVQPGAFDYAIDAQEGLNLTRELLNEFFDAYLRDNRVPDLQVDPAVTVRRFEKP